jgi:type III secretory pathway component EscS
VIIYLASVGIAIILIGRARRVPAARHAGLALAIVAGVKALLQASTLAFGLRLSSYLVVGAFLLGVAYLYRATSDTGTEVV